MNLRIGQFLRLITIYRVLARYQLDDIIFLPWYLRFLLPGYWARRLPLPRGIRIRRALEELGPIFVKFGQMIGTRADLLPEDITEELALLQDRVTPFSGIEARQLIETALGDRLEKFFQDFDLIPLAAASVAQVHAARLHNGHEVVIKVLRPNIRPIIRHDLELLYTIADLAQRYSPETRRFRPRAVVAELEKTIWNELDLIREAANSATLRRNFFGSEMLYIPKVEWDYTRAEVLVLERIYGTKVSDVPSLIQQGVNLKLLAERGVEVFFTQVFQHNFFHADMHPGNIFVIPPACYIAVDFGIMGSLSTQDQRYLAENLLAFFRRDYRQVAEVHIASGWVAPNTRVDEFEAAIRSVCEPIFQRPFGEISFGHLLLRLFQVARSFNMEVQPQLVLLQKTLLNIEGMGRSLYPELNLWTTAQPFLERWMGERLSAWTFMRKVMEKAPRWGEQLPELPLLVIEILREWHEEQIQNRTAPLSEMKMLTQEIRYTGERIILALLGVTLLLTGIIFQLLDKSYSAGDFLLFNLAIKPFTLLMLSGSGILFFKTWRY